MIYLGEKLRTLRIQKDWTQEQLANKLGIDKSAISQYESCLRLPSLNVLIKLCYAFNLSADYFLEINIDNYIKIPINDLTESQINTIIKVIEEYRKANVKSE